MVVNTAHGMTWESGPEVLSAFERYKKDPAPHVPHFLVFLDERRVRSADQRTWMMCANAASLLTFGNAEGRKLLRQKLVEFQTVRDGLRATQSAALKGLPAKPSAAELAPLLAREEEIKNLIRVERSGVSGFASQRSLELRDLVLSRVETDSDLQDTYVDYFEATAKADPEVRARLQKMLDSKRALGLAPHLKRFLAASR